MGKRKKKKNQKKGVQMLKYYNYSYGNWGKPSVEKPEESTNPYDLCIVAHRHDIIEEICERALESEDAHGNEFQFHYTALQAILTHPSGIKLVLTFPTAYFNFPQEVSGALIEYNLEDIETERERVLQHVVEQPEQIVAVLEPILNLYMEQGYNVKVVHAEVGSVHRHPGRFSFSSTDLRNDPTNPGVVFRNLRAKDYYQIDHVIYVDEKYRGVSYMWDKFTKKLIPKTEEDDGRRLKDVEFITSQCRLVNVEPVNGRDGFGGIKGSYLTTPTILFERIRADATGEQPEEKIRLSVNTIAKTFANIDSELPGERIMIDPVLKKYNLMHFNGTNTIDENILSIFASIIDTVLSAYEPYVDINPEYIKARSWGGRSYYYPSTSTLSTTTQTTYEAKTSDFISDEDIVVDEDDILAYPIEDENDTEIDAEERFSCVGKPKKNGYGALYDYYLNPKNSKEVK